MPLSAPSLPGMPKPPSRRARGDRGNPNDALFKVVEFTPGTRPALPNFDLPWHPFVLEWWDILAEDQMSRFWSQSDWYGVVLAMHAVNMAVWDNNPMTAAKALDSARQLLNDFGLTTKGAQMLRIIKVQADVAEAEKDLRITGRGYEPEVSMYPELKAVKPA